MNMLHDVGAAREGNMDSSSTSHSSNKVGAVDVRVRALQQLEGADAVRIAEEVLHDCQRRKVTAC